MSAELKEALEQLGDPQYLLSVPMGPHMEVIVEAARRVAEADEVTIENLRPYVDHVGVTLLLSRVLELAGMPMGQVVSKDLGGFASMLEVEVLRGLKRALEGRLLLPAEEGK